jgi:hypothetical protein
MASCAALSEHDILLALGERHEAIAALREYEHRLTRRAGPPISDVARSELIKSNAQMIEKIEGHIRDLASELGRR